MMGPFGWLGGILFLVLIVLAIVWLWRALDLGRTIGATSHSSKVTDRALETARERYAKGEIDDQEFERLRRDLTS
ncbi:MAG: SHOCT domain-containing protein [Trueperaceae bacterium]|nr:SHOCT domain-containing protein [Trueperaceae bacterium]